MELTSTANPEAQKISHSGNLDFVRSFAVLLVVGRHVAGLIGYTHLGPVPLQFVGIFGVMLFFVLTAHVLMFSLEKISKTESSMRSIHRTFFIRRAFLIYFSRLRKNQLCRLSLQHIPGTEFNRCP